MDYRLYLTEVYELNIHYYSCRCRWPNNFYFVHPYPNLQIQKYIIILPHSSRYSDSYPLSKASLAASFSLFHLQFTHMNINVISIARVCTNKYCLTSIALIQLREMASVTVGAAYKDTAVREFCDFLQSPCWLYPVTRFFSGAIESEFKVTLS